MIERPLTEALNMGRLALDIAGVLGVGVSVEVRAALGAEYTPSSAAQAAYFEERAQMARNGGETSAAAEAMFERAIALDPRYARPYVVLSHCYYEANLPRAITDVGPRAVAAARRAVELDDRLALAHRQLALATFIFRGDSKEAVREFRRAVELNPSDFSVQSYFANFLSSLGELEEAKRHVAVGHDLSPFDADAWGIDGMVHYYAREYDQAEAGYRRGFELAPRFNRYVGLGRVLIEKRDCTGAVQAFEQALRSVVGPRLVRGACASVRGLRPDRRCATDSPRSRGRALDARHPPGHTTTPRIRLCRPRREGSRLRAADAGCRRKHTDLRWARVDPRLDPLRSDPRFHTYLRALGIEE